MEEPSIERDKDPSHPKFKLEEGFVENSDHCPDQAVNHISHIWIKEEEPSIKEEPLDERDMKVSDTCDLQGLCFQERESIPLKSEHSSTRNDQMMADIDCETLIMAVEKHPIVWDTACSDYKDRQKKVNAWINICEDVVENFADIEDRAKNYVGKKVQVKWKTLRDSFRKTHFANKHAPSGSGAKKRKYLYANQMQFLLNTFEAAETVSNITERNCDEQDDSEVPPQPKIERKVKKPKSVDLQITEYLNKQDESESDETGLFFKSLLSSVKDFTEDEKLELKGGVISLISNIRKARSNYSQNNISQTSGATTYYS